jgi:hypothetical protein
LRRYNVDDIAEREVGGILISLLALRTSQSSSVLGSIWIGEVRAPGCLLSLLVEVISRTPSLRS